MIAFRLDARQRELCRPREVEEVGDDLVERLGLGSDAFDIGPVRRRQRIQIEQLAIPLNRRQAVAEFVRDAGGELPDRRQTLLQTQLLLRDPSRP